MDVSTSVNILNTIGYLRSHVYPMDTFVNTFNESLKNNIGANNISFVPEQYGGYSINADTSYSTVSEYPLLVTNTLESFSETLKKTNPNLIYTLENIHNLVNVVSTGQNSVIIKI